jgi:hypothetical protein
MKISSYYPTRDFAAAAAPSTSDNANAVKQARQNLAIFFSINTSYSFLIKFLLHTLKRFPFQDEATSPFLCN